MDSMKNKDESTKTPPDKKKPTDCDHCEIQREECWLQKKKALMAINVHFHAIKKCHLKSQHGVQRNFSRSSILVRRSTSESFDFVFSWFR